MNLTANHTNHANRKDHPRRGCSRGSGISRFTASGQCPGNLTQDGRWHDTWDAENRLVKLAAGTGAGPQISLQFDYDHQGRRIRQRVWNNPTWSGNPTNDVRYVYDGWNLLASLNPASAVPQAYLWGLDLSGTMQGAGGVGGLLAITDASQGSHFCAYDGNGNVTALVKADGAGLSAQYEYGPFGELLRATGPMAKANPFRFSTKYQDDESDYLYYGYRYYDPSTGRWPNRDPLGEAGFELLRGGKPNAVGSGVNLYLFVENNPITEFDPLGLDFWDGIKSAIRSFRCYRCKYIGQVPVGAKYPSGEGAVGAAPTICSTERGAPNELVENERARRRAITWAAACALRDELWPTRGVSARECRGS
jgi:RHS repeat-associated protein